MSRWSSDDISLVECRFLVGRVRALRAYRDHYAAWTLVAGDDFDTRRSFLASLLNQRKTRSSSDDISLVECELCERIETIPWSRRRASAMISIRGVRSSRRYSINEVSRWSSASASECIETITRSQRRASVMISIRGARSSRRNSINEVSRWSSASSASVSRPLHGLNAEHR